MSVASKPFEDTSLYASPRQNKNTTRVAKFLMESSLAGKRRGDQRGYTDYESRIQLFLQRQWFSICPCITNVRLQGLDFGTSPYSGEYPRGLRSD
jgi:hypothetical protein